MTATVVALADHRKRREPDAMSLLLGGFEFMALCNIAALYLLVVACRTAQGDRHEAG